MEMKMRAFYKPLNLMLGPGQIESINFETKVLGVYMEMDGKGYHQLRISDFDIMWFTGLQDRNGKEIYGGDIIKTILGHTAVVEWGNEDGRYLAFTVTRRIMYVGREPKVEVIGNRFDDPDLLGEVRE